MKLADHAQLDTNKTAIIDEAGASLSFNELELKSSQLANHLHQSGLRPGDTVAILLKNCIDYFVIAWAAQRSGLYFTPVNWHLTTSEAAYIVRDCEAKALFADFRLHDLALHIRSSENDLTNYYSCNGDINEYMTLDAAIENQPVVQPEIEPAGQMMVYSSGTTGFPKGIKRPLTGMDYRAPLGLEPLMSDLWGFDKESVYLSPAPLYHAAPLGWCMSTQKLGGTTVIMDSFDGERFLSLIEQYSVSHTQCVPTMFIRMLDLPDDVLQRYNYSSLQFVTHAAAPCPIETKADMIAWWGPIIHEFYSGSEGFGLCAIDSETWLRHKGSVGKPLLGKIHIVDEYQNKLPALEVGTVYFENSAIDFKYHNDDKKTRDCQLNGNLATFGDMGYLDSEGFLYLVDRRTDLIISGGVNIYPSETEDILRQHSAVLDVAVIGRPNKELGQKVVAVVELPENYVADEQLSSELIHYCQQRIAKFKCPRDIEYAPLPRTPTGKLLRRKLRAAP